MNNVLCGIIVSGRDNGKDRLLNVSYAYQELTQLYEDL